MFLGSIRLVWVHARLLCSDLSGGHFCFLARELDSPLTIGLFSTPASITYGQVRGISLNSVRLEG